MPDSHSYLPPASVPAHTIYVGKDYGDFHSINEAVRAAQPGAQIVLRPGLYEECVAIYKPLELVGQGPAEQVIIRGLGAPAVVVVAPSASLRGLTLQRLVSDTEAKPDFRDLGRVMDGPPARPVPVEQRRKCLPDSPCLDLSGGTATVADCLISCYCGDGVRVAGAETRAAVTGCRIHDCTADGMRIAAQAAAEIEHCEFGDNHRGLVASEATVSAAGCSFRGGRYGLELAGKGIVVSGATIEGCQIGARVSKAAVLETSEVQRCMQGLAVEKGGRVRECHIHCCSYRGVHLSGRGAVEHCEIHDNAGAQVIIKSGDSLLRECSVHDGDVGVSLWGKGRVVDCEVTGQREAGIAVGGRGVIIKGCRVHDNVGDGIYARGSELCLDYCDIGRNESTGVVLIDSQSVLRQCTIDGNRQGLCVERGDSLCEGCAIAARFDYALVLNGKAAATEAVFRGCEIDLGKRFHSAADISENAAAVFEQCDFRGEGHLLCSDPKPSFNSCTLNGAELTGPEAVLDEWLEEDEYDLEEDEEE